MPKGKKEHSSIQNSKRLRIQLFLLSDFDMLHLVRKVDMPESNEMKLLYSSQKKIRQPIESV